MRALSIVILLVLTAALSIAGHMGSRVEYLGGTRGDIPPNRPGLIRLTDDTYFIYVSKNTEVKIPYERIDLVEYGQKVDRRYVAAAIISPLFLMTRKREHFLTIGFEDDDAHQQAMMFRVDKDAVRLTLVSLEARTGRKIEYQDDDARMAGKE